MVFLLPASPVHAAGATVTLSATSGAVYSTLAITGSGFYGASPITITSLVGTSSTPVNWLTLGTCATTGSGTSSLATEGLNPVDSLINSGCLTTTSTGSFEVSTLVPVLPGGSNTITVSDGVNTIHAAFTVTPQIVISSHDLSGFPGQTLSKTTSLTACNGGAAVLACLTGFGSGDSVTVTSTFTASTNVVNTFTAGSTAGTYGVIPITGSFSVIDAVGGTKSVVATDLTTSSLTASASFTLNPWVAFYDSNTGATTFSVTSGTPLTSLFIEGHGFPAGTFNANTITVGGQTTTHASVTISSTGTFGVGYNNHLQLGPPSGGFGLGNLAIVVDGFTFSYAAGNIVDSQTGAGIYAGSAENWGGALIGSVPGTVNTGTAFVSLDQSSYKPGTPTASYYGPSPVQNQIGVFGYGFVPTKAAGVAAGANTPALGTITYVTGTAAVNGEVDPNGAFFATVPLLDTPYSNTVPSTSTATAYGITVPVTVGTTPSTINSPTFTVTPWIDTHSITSANPAYGPEVDYQSQATFSIHGFGDGETVSYAIGGTAFPTAVTVTASATGCAVVVALAGCTTIGALGATDQVPDLAGGAQSASATGVLTGEVATAAGAFFYVPLVNFAGTAGAFNPNSGPTGQLATLRTQTGYGVHGLAANTAYNVVWNGLGSTVVLGTFTSTATGGVPVPGKQVTIPSDSAGIHIVDIQAASGTTSAIYGTVIQDTTSSLAGNTGQFGDLLFNEQASLLVSPSVGTIGVKNTISGNGLSAGTSYVIALSDKQSGIDKNAQALGTVVASSTGSVPSGTSVTLTDTPTALETGTVEYFDLIPAATFGTTSTPSATGQFVLAASATLNMSAAPAGHPVILTAHALNGPNATSANPGSVYSIIFNYVQSTSSPTVYTGTPVGIIAPNSLGAGTSTFNVPANVNCSPCTIQLVTNGAGTGGAVAGTAVLDIPLSFTVGSVATSCNSTSCVSASGSPVQSTQGAYTGVTTSFTNNSNAPITGFVYAVVHNALGQTVDISTATITAPAGGSTSAFNALFGLPPGTYTVSIFVASNAGTAISSTSTATVTIG